MQYLTITPADSAA